MYVNDAYNGVSLFYLLVCFGSAKRPPRTYVPRKVGGAGVTGALAHVDTCVGVFASSPRASRNPARSNEPVRLLTKRTWKEKTLLNFCAENVHRSLLSVDYTRRLNYTLASIVTVATH